MTTHNYGRILRLSEVVQRTGIGRSSIYLWIEQGHFPRQIALGARAVGWLESEVNDWIQNRITMSRG